MKSTPQENKMCEFYWSANTMTLQMIFFVQVWSDIEESIWGSKKSTQVDFSKPDQNQTTHLFYVFFMAGRCCKETSPICVD